MVLQESVRNYIFRAVVKNGVITVSGYADIYGAGITSNLLRGAVVLANLHPIGYVRSSTAWYNGGCTATLGYNTLSLQGLVDIAFVFPSGRLMINTVPVHTLAQGATDMEFSAPIHINAQPQITVVEPRCHVMLRTGAGTTNVSSRQSKLRGGVYTEET